MESYEQSVDQMLKSSLFNFSRTASLLGNDVIVDGSAHANLDKPTNLEKRPSCVENGG